MIDEFNQICTELNVVRSNLTVDKAEAILKLIFQAHQVFLSGEGRSGLMVKALANRLTQVGLEVHVTTEITSPAIGKGDVLIFNSASGKSAFLISQAKSAKSLGAKVITFTAKEYAPLNESSDLIIGINAQSKDENLGSIQPMGSLYEQASLLIFDSLILKALNNGLVTNKQLRSTHSNLE